MQLSLGPALGPREASAQSCGKAGSLVGIEPATGQGPRNGSFPGPTSQGSIGRAPFPAMSWQKRAARATVPHVIPLCLGQRELRSEMQLHEGTPAQPSQTGAECPVHFSEATWFLKPALACRAS